MHDEDNHRNDHHHNQNNVDKLPDTFEYSETGMGFLKLLTVAAGVGVPTSGLRSFEDTEAGIS